MLVASVADGAGSAKLSDVGSGVAACAATQMASMLLRDHNPPLTNQCLPMFPMVRCPLQGAHWKKRRNDREES